jgi:hypothetical protein
MLQVLQETTKGVKHFLKKDFCSFFGQIATVILRWFGRPTKICFDKRAIKNTPRCWLRAGGSDLQLLIAMPGLACTSIPPTVFVFAIDADWHWRVSVSACVKTASAPPNYDCFGGVGDFVWMRL